jgi:ElaB/YqjD/DUF883 family membrane-anchored ribosome-binding protein
MAINGTDSSMEKSEDKIENVLDEPVGSVGGVANTANKAVRDTAQKYLNAVGMKVDLKDVEERLREQSLLSIGIAAGVGFILGGGLGTRPGVTLLGLLGRRAARQMTTNAGRELPQNARLRNDRAR